MGAKRSESSELISICIQANYVGSQNYLSDAEVELLNTHLRPDPSFQGENPVASFTFLNWLQRNENLFDKISIQRCEICYEVDTLDNLHVYRMPLLSEADYQREE